MNHEVWREEERVLVDFHRRPVARFGYVVLLAFLCSFQPVEAEEQKSTPQWTIKRFQAEEILGTRQIVQAKNLHGDIRCRAAAQEKVEVLANIQNQEDDPYEAEIRIEKDAARLIIEVVYVRRPSMDAVQETEQMKRRRVDLTLILPAEAKLEAQTSAGLVEAKGLHADIRADSLSGDVVLSTKGSVLARSERGAINATLLNSSWSDPPRLTTITGNITVWLLRDANVTVAAETEGVISTDYSIEVTREPSGRKKTAKAVLGEGARQLIISSIKGEVRLFQQPQ